jgi:heme A synthase
MSVEAELQELRRRRRNRRIVIAVSCIVVLIVVGVWLSQRNSTMSCGDWQAEYMTAVQRSGGTMPATGHGTVANLEQVRPEGCPAPTLPPGS